MNISPMQKTNAAIKDTGEAFLFTFFMQRKWLTIFTNSPFYFVLMPLLGINILLNTIFTWMNFSKAHNKNGDKLFGALTTNFAANAALVSITGGLIAKGLGATFIAGPWLFFTSLVILASQQLVMLSLNSYRALNSSEKSNKRNAFIQKAIHNLFNIALIGLMISSVLVVLITPAAPIVIAIVSGIAAGLTLINLAWSILTHLKPEWITRIKAFVGLDEKKTTLNADLLTNKIQAKIEEQESLSRNSKKAEDKLDVLRQLKNTLQSNSGSSFPNKEKTIQQYPLAFQSFFKPVGEVEELYDEVTLLSKGPN